MEGKKKIDHRGTETQRKRRRKERFTSEAMSQ
jgi:hypothetical protein